MVDRTESSLAVVWNNISRATFYDVQRSDSEAGDYAVVATKVAATGLVDEGLQADSDYYYLVRACNHLGCSEYSDDAVASSPGSGLNHQGRCCPQLSHRWQRKSPFRN